MNETFIIKAYNIMKHTLLLFAACFVLADLGLRLLRRRSAPKATDRRGLLRVLESAGRDRAALGIRSTAGDPDTRVVDKGQATQSILAAPAADTDLATAQVPQQ